MKFSHSIQFNAVPEWSSHYIAYSTLKKLIYQLEKAAHQAQTGDVESRPLVGHEEEPEEVFTRALDVELEKVSSFYVVKEGELFEDSTRLLREIDGQDPTGGGLLLDSSHAVDDGDRHSPTPLGPHSDRDSDDDSDDDDDETAGLARRSSSLGRRRNLRSLARTATERTASTDIGRMSRRRSTTMTDFGEQSMIFSSGLFNSGIMSKKRIISLYVQLCELKSYVQLNRTGFSKVLKKYDKILDQELRSRYLSKHVDTAYPFHAETLAGIDDRASKMVAAYAEVVTDKDIDMARKDLRSHLREHVVWERNTVWRELIGLERRAEAASLGRSFLGRSGGVGVGLLQGDDTKPQRGKVITTPVGRISCPEWLFSSSALALCVAAALFAIILFAPLMDSPEQQGCLAMLLLVSVLWATEAIPLFVTSLMVPFICVILRIIRSDDGQQRLSAKDATAYVFASMWTPVIMLLIGGFTLAAALSKCKIDKRLATLVLSKAGTNPKTVLIANMFVAAFASMLVSNVAAPVLCFSIIEPMLRTLPSDSDMSKAVIMGIALASNIGGMLSPIASPQNLVAVQNMSPEPSWGQWFFIVIPVGAISLLLIWVLLLVAFKPDRGISIAPVRPVKERLTAAQWFVSLVTLTTIILWCLSSQLEPVFGDMGVVALIPLVLFFGSGILTKEDFNNFPWTIIMLAAGGLSLGKAVKSSGLLHTVGAFVSRDIHELGLYGVLVTFSALILVIATFISHTVAALIILPLVANVGRDMDDQRPNLLVMAGVLMCSAAMGLPTSGFPNMTAIMKEDSAGQRYLSVKHFITIGVPSSLITLVVVITIGYGAMLVADID